MKLLLLSPAKSLNKAYLKQSLKREQMETFKAGLKKMFGHIDEKQDEEYHKNIISKLLSEAYYKNKYLINVNKKQDLVIRSGNKTNDEVAVIIEFKKPTEKRDMLSKEKHNVKALHELVLYYLRETIENGNRKITYLIATNIFEWFIFDEIWFEKNIFGNTQLKKEYENWKVSGHDTSHFYIQIAAKYLDTLNEEVPCTYFNLKDFEQIISNPDTTDDITLLELYKILSPEHLLKKPFANDSNTLNKEFYSELLHIIGLEETKDGNKKIITRKESHHRDEGSLIENAINILKRDKRYGYEENPEIEFRYFELALELCITWLNRILFLKLLEGQLIKYHRGDESRSFLNAKSINDFDELDELFFEVLAVPIGQRSQSVTEKFGNIPYLNSSLFEQTETETNTILIRDLKSRLQIPIYPVTVLKDDFGKRIAGKKNTLLYLFEFLAAYDFASEGKAKIQEQNKSIINASVLGLIFEKINGYKDGSFFTPGFITMYMCRETIRPAVVQKFNEKYNWNCQTLDDIEQKLDYTDKEQRKEANVVINSLKICDPAVGSGHFLVSALNELIAIKSDLQILNYRDGNRIKGYKILIVNDELLITNNEDDQLFEYTLNQNDRPINDLQKLQEALFHEKQTLIENCLFGVDLNPKSVLICRLRLWVELLKNSYYRPLAETQLVASLQLETLPNIDINIKCGNSLINRFAFDPKTPLLAKDRPYLKGLIANYKVLVAGYKNATDKKSKDNFRKTIYTLKTEFEKFTFSNDKQFLQLKELKDKLGNRQFSFFYTEEEKNIWIKETEKLTNQVAELESQYAQKLSTIYGNTMEWRFEFPEVLDEEGLFVGFDVVIGNPPYIRQEEFAEIKSFLHERFSVYNSIADLLTYFVELGFEILKPMGSFQFVISNKFTRANYGKQLRSFLSNKTQLTHFIDFSGVPIFDEATVDAAIVGFVKFARKSHSILYANFKKDKFSVIDFENHLNQVKLFYPQLNLSESTWAFENEEALKIKQKVEKQGVPLKEWDLTINYGIKTGLNDAFVVDGAKCTQLIAGDQRSNEFLKPLLRGRDIWKYCPNDHDLWLIYIPKGYTIKTMMGITENTLNEPMPRYGFVEQKMAWDWFRNQFPAISDHLIQFKEIAEKRADMGDYWWEQRACAYLPSFEKPKIIYPNMTKFLPFIIDLEGDYYHNDKTFQILTDRIYWLGSFLNSTLFKYCFKDNFAELLGGTRELRKVFFEPIPVMKLTEEQENPFEKLVMQIIKIKKSNPLADTSDLEMVIDKMVFKLYGLTEDEIKIVTNSKTLNGIT